MPTLTRYIAVLVILASIAYGTMFALVTYVDPATRQMGYPISDDRFNR
ncbi:hypothetical protein GGD81_003967 [Rhodobium orientis]|uniref:Histidine kinase n=1 Tax=Rhodobium orientis TaxID=34017 RepID=A0A327JP86_9HYPH|nr:histidine kinase [Rhodobium orientis]MBB4304902.1 hypothetical protein [Rhodobium orientis]MBK5949230.1 histidine kinase [Rhodobium orientis]RAI27396.1 histidine kinase [Rhodobium orientis]